MQNAKLKKEEKVERKIEKLFVSKFLQQKFI